MAVPEEHEAIILGGGLAGLSAAYHSGFPLYEMSQKPGGTAASSDRSGFVFDLGIHILHSKNPYVLELLEKLGVSFVTHQRNGWIYSHNSYFPYPFQVNTSHLPFFPRLRCLTGFLRARGSRCPANYADWIMQNFGAGFAELFLIPYADKFWRVPAASMTCDWTEQRIPRPGALDVLKGFFATQRSALGSHVEFRYPAALAEGYGAIGNALAGAVKNLHLGMRAVAINPARKQVVFRGPDLSVGYRKLISTLPLPELLKLLPNVPESIGNACRALKCNSIAIVNLGIDLPHLSDRHWIHFPEPDIAFFRISYASNFAAGLAPQGTCSLQAEVAYLGEPPDRARLLDQVKNDLVRVGVLPASAPILFEDVVFLPYGYVIYTHDRREAVEAIHAYLHDLDIYPCGRYGNWEYLWSDQAILSGKQVAERLAR